VNAPDYAEAIIAWRAWLVVADGEEIRLSSVVHKTVWAPRCELEASCHRRTLSLPRFSRKKSLGHSAPAEDCRCGIYGARDAERAARFLLLAINPARCLPTNFWLGPPHWPLLDTAIGRVSLWGSVVECEHGWRASHAYPERLYLLGRSEEEGSVSPREEVAAGLSVYGVPLRVLECEMDSSEAVVAALRSGAAIHFSS
jgi:hypothetical protein